MDRDTFFMRHALKLAMTAYSMNEVPVGAVIVHENKIVSCGYNTREIMLDPLGHAEINAIKAAALAKRTKRLSEMTLYVTLEPCPMCAGASLEAGISKIIFGAYDEKFGACGTLMNVADYPGFSKRAIIKGGVLEEESVFLLQKFFTSLRDSRKKRRDG